MDSCSQIPAGPHAPWIEHKVTLKELYLHQRKTLKEVKAIMEAEHDFPPFPLSIYETRLRDVLHLRKKLKKEEWAAVGTHLSIRGEKRSEMYLDGVVIPSFKVRKELSRNRALVDKSRQMSSYLGGPPPLPLGVTITTPPASPSTDPSGSLFSHPDGPPTQQTLVDFNLATDVDSDFPEFSFGGFSDKLPDRTASSNIDLFFSEFPWNGPMSLISGAETVHSGVSPIVNDTQSSQLCPNKLLEETLQVGLYSNTVFSDIMGGGMSRLKDLWSPFLNDLPIFDLQSRLEKLSLNSSSGTLADQTLATRKHQSIFSALEFCDPATGYPSSVSANDIDALMPVMFSHNYPMSSGDTHMEVAAHMNPFQLLIDGLYALSNNLWKGRRLLENVRTFVKHIPRSLFTVFFCIESPTIDATWAKLLNCAAWEDNKTLFLSLMEIVTTKPHLLRTTGRLCLLLSSWFDCPDTCERLLSDGWSPNDVSKFPVIREFAAPKIGTVRISNGPECEHYFKFRPKTTGDYTANFILTFPLIEAALRGNRQSVNVLLRRGAQVDIRHGGLTPSGYLLLALSRQSLNRENCLECLGILLEAGADVDLPLWEHPSLHPQSTSDYYPRPYDGSGLDSSEASLGDKAFVMDADVSSLVLACTTARHRPITIWGVVSHGELGLSKLRNYLETTSFPKGLRRKRLLELSLHAAFIANRLCAARSILHNGVDPNLPHLQHSSLQDNLILKICLSPAEKVANLLSQPHPHPALQEVALFLFETEPAIRTSLLSHSVAQDRLEGLRYLLESGMCISEEDGLVAMAKAARENNFVGVHLLQSHGVNINGFVATSVLRVSLLNGVPIIPGHKYPCSVLCLALATSVNHSVLRKSRSPATEEMLDFLLRQGADINMLTSASSVSSGFQDVICSMPVDNLTWLLDKGFDVKSTSLRRVLHSVIQEINTVHAMGIYDFNGALDPSLAQTLEILLRHGIPTLAPVERQKDFGNFSCVIHPLCVLISGNMCVESMHRILDTGIRVTGNIREGETPLQTAVRMGNLAMVKMLISRGARVNDLSAAGEGSALGEACARKNPHPPRAEVARHLLCHGADINPAILASRYRFHTLRTPLCAACSRGVPDIELITLLLDHGAHVNERCIIEGDDFNALEVACGLARPSLELVKLLLASGAELNHQTESEHYRSALARVCTTDSPDIPLIKFLIEQGADINGPGVLTEVIKHGNILVMLMFIAAGARVSSGGGNLDECPLTLAAKYGRLDMVRLLLNFETDLEVFGKATEKARAEEHYAIERLILAYREGDIIGMGGAVGEH